MIRFRVQFGINLHEWVFQNAEIARAAWASAISAFWKTHKCKFISNWTRKTEWLLINNTNMKKFAPKKVPEDVSWSHFFELENTFSRVAILNFCHCLIWYHWPSKISHCLSANHNSELRFVICTGVTFELHCSQPIRIEWFFPVYYYITKRYIIC